MNPNMARSHESLFDNTDEGNIAWLDQSEKWFDFLLIQGLMSGFDTTEMLANLEANDNRGPMHPVDVFWNSVLFGEATDDDTL